MLAPPRLPWTLRIFAWLIITAVLPIWLAAGALAGMGDVLMTWGRVTKEVFQP